MALLRRAHNAGRAGGRADDRALFERYQACRDRQLRDAIVARYLPLARSIARRFRSSTESFDDIVQVACLSLIKAVDHFDAGKGVEFSSYAVPSITGEIKRHFRDHTWALRVPRDVKELALRVERISEDLTARLGRRPTVAEVADGVGVSVQSVLAARDATTAYRTDSLHAPSRDGDGDSSVAQSVGGRDSGFEQVEDREALGQLTRCLTARERAVLILRFDHGLTQNEIARCLGVSQMTVSRDIRQILERLRHLARTEDGLVSSGPARKAVRRP